MNNGILIVDGYNASLDVERGHLVIRDGFPIEGKAREIRFPRGRCEINRIIIRATGGFSTISAIDWCARMGISIAFLASDSTLLNCLIPDYPHDGPVKRAQAIAAITDDGPKLARYLLREKIETQTKTISHDFARLGIGATKSRADAVSQIETILKSLEKAETLVDFLTMEGRAAQIYWDLLTDTPLPWPDWCLRRIPGHWAAISARTNGRRDRVRDATDPFNALLNYGYTLLEVETRIACEATGLDPDLGLLHTDDRLRESFIYDLMEPARCSVDVAVLEHIRKHGLRPHMVHELRDGVVRIDPDLASSLAEAIVPRLVKHSLRLANEFVKQLRRVEIPYRLVRSDRKVGTEKPVLQNCVYCKEPLPRKGLKFCGRHCYLRYSVEIAKPIEKAQARLSEMRCAGLSPGHGGEAAKKRGAKIAESNRNRSLGLTPDESRARRAAQGRDRRAGKQDRGA